MKAFGALVPGLVGHLISRIIFARQSPQLTLNRALLIQAFGRSRHTSVEGLLDGALLHFQQRHVQPQRNAKPRCFVRILMPLPYSSLNM